MTSDISIKRLQEFYEALGKCIEEWNNSARDELKEQGLDIGSDQHPDFDFFSEQKTNISIDYWLTQIPSRMNREEIIYFSSLFNPFVSCDLYTANSVWFALAFDIQKILNDPQKTWFSICFPHLNHFDPITFRSLFHVMPAHIYVVKKLFAAPLSDFILPDLLSNIKWVSEAEMVKVYFPKAYSPNPCYVFEEKTKRLYYFVADPNPEIGHQGGFMKMLVFMDAFHQQNFVKNLSVFLQSARKQVKTKTYSYEENDNPHPVSSFNTEEKNLLSSISEDFMEKSTKIPEKNQHYRSEIWTDGYEATCYIVDSRHLEKLVTDHGGYPNFDLRRFALNHDRSRIYFVDSLLYPREVLNTYLMEDDTVSQLRSFQPTQRHRAGEIMTLNPNKPSNGYRVKPHHYAAMYTGKNAIRPAALTLIDLHNMIWKRNALFYYRKNTVYTHPEDYLALVLMPTWQARGRVPKLILPRLLRTFCFYFELLEKEETSPQAFRLLLNEWSSDKWRNKSHFYPWNEDEMQDRLFLYTQAVFMLVPSDTPGRYSNFLLLLLNCLHTPLDKIYGEVLNLARWVTEYAPHIIASDPHLDLVYEDLCVAHCFNVSKLIDCLEELKPTVNGHLLFSLSNFIYRLTCNYEDRLDSVSIDTKYLNELIALYKMYDEYVSINFKYDHFKALDYPYTLWRRLAEMLAGAGWVDDVIGLLCPTVVNKIEPNIRMPFADFDPQELVLTQDRTALVALASSRNYFGRTKLFFNCNNKKEPVPFTFKELMAIQEAEPRYHAFGFQAYKQYGGEPLSLSTCLMLHFFTHLILDPSLLDINKPGFVRQRYEIKYINYQKYELIDNKLLKRNGVFSSLLSFFPSRSLSENVIYVALTEKGVWCLIHDNKQIAPKSIFIFFKDLGISELKRQTISRYNLNRYILRYLEIEKYIPHYYSAMARSSCLTGEAVFFDFYKKMPAKERYVLDNHVVQINGNKKTFKQILKTLHFSRPTASIFLMALLINIDSDFVFSLNPFPDEDEYEKNISGDGRKKDKKIKKVIFDENTDDKKVANDENTTDKKPIKVTGAEKKLEKLFKNWRKVSYQLPYKDIRHDIDVFFISLMTMDFTKNIPDDETVTIEWFLEDIVYHGYINKIPKILIPVFMRVLGEKDLDKQEKIYVNAIRNTIYAMYYRDLTEYRSETNFAINKNFSAWVALIVTNQLRYFVNVCGYDWLQTVYLYIRPDSLILTEDQLDKFMSFQNTLKAAPAYSLSKNKESIFSDFAPERLVANIKYIYFLRALSIEDFFGFWKAIDSPYRKKVLIDYVAKFGCRMDDFSLTLTTREVFADYLQDMPTEQSTQSILDRLVDHLMGEADKVDIIPRVRTSSSPWF